jgi:ppGpp synthetase/RelA/SpoT-type nucleotidyltranferase
MNFISPIRWVPSYMSRWAVPLFSKKEANRAGELLVSASSEDTYHDDWYHALEVINNFRSIHGHPLNTFQTTLRIKGRSVDPSIIVAQRIKRLSSIKLKLERFPTMTLSQMQDIGGCRAVVSDVTDVDRLVESYISSDLKHKLHTNDDYIINPKPTGYRGRHLIYQYFSDKISTYNGLKVEMQFRSQFQHAWATAVEIVGTFTRQALKSSQGEEDWLRFFALMGSAIARMESTPNVPDTPTLDDDLVLELKDAEHHLDAMRRLRAFSTAPAEIETMAGGAGKSHFFLMTLDLITNQLTIEGYPSRDLDVASAKYLEIEKRLEDNPSSDAVLVSVESLSALRRAYPNYYLDNDLFVWLVEQALSGQFY